MMYRMSYVICAISDVLCWMSYMDVLGVAWHVLCAMWDACSAIWEV